MDIENKKDKEIIEQLLNILNTEYVCHKYFNDGASSRVILLNNSYLIKQNTKPVLEAEIEFLKLNTSKYFQQIVYVDPNYEFVVYNFIHGETMKYVDDVDDTIYKIIDMISLYADYNHDGFGYLNEEVPSWSQFLQKETTFSNTDLVQHLPDRTIVNDCIKILEKYPFNKKLLHGDFGTHNFIKENGKLVGVIDPMPVIGDYLYDLLFAIASNVKILLHFTMDKLYNLIDEPKEKINAMLTIVLYSRMYRCLKYHPQDFDIYMNFWNELMKEII